MDRRERYYAREKFNRAVTTKNRLLETTKNEKLINHRLTAKNASLPLFSEKPMKNIQVINIEKSECINKSRHQGCLI